MLASHYNKCKKKHCVRCFWHRRGPALRKQFGFREKKSGERRPWLVMAMHWRNKDKPVLGIGCWLCCQYQTMLQQKQDGLTSASTFADLSLQADLRRGLSAQCKKHEDCKFHKDALLHCTTGTGAVLSCIAPPAKEFQSCLRRMRKGRSARDGGGCSDKTNLMRWCLTEAMLDEHRAAARKCSSVVLIRDERQGKLMVRFRLCESATLNVRSGVLALETLPGWPRGGNLAGDTSRPGNVLPKSLQCSAGVSWFHPRVRQGLVREAPTEVPDGGNGLCVG